METEKYIVFYPGDSFLRKPFFRLVAAQAYIVKEKLNKKPSALLLIRIVRKSIPTADCAFRRKLSLKLHKSKNLSEN